MALKHSEVAVEPALDRTAVLAEDVKDEDLSRSVAASHVNWDEGRLVDRGLPSLLDGRSDSPSGERAADGLKCSLACCVVPETGLESPPSVFTVIVGTCSSPLRIGGGMMVHMFVNPHRFDM